MDSKTFFNQIKVQLPHNDGVAIKAEDGKLNFYVDGRLEFYVRETGGVSFVSDCSYTDKVKKLSDITIETSGYVREYLEAIDNAPNLQVDGVANDFKLLAQFNNIVLAGRIMSQGEHVEFVTWDKGPRGMSAGHYYGSNFIGAKEDFAVRADIVNQDKIFSTSELVEIYRCVDESLRSEYLLTGEQEKTLAEIKSKITEVIPDISERLIVISEKLAQAIVDGEFQEPEQNEGQTMM